jgi:hypothetical protein
MHKQQHKLRFEHHLSIDAAIRQGIFSLKSATNGCMGLIGKQEHLCNRSTHATRTLAVQHGSTYATWQPMHALTLAVSGRWMAYMPWDKVTDQNNTIPELL